MKLELPRCLLLLAGSLLAVPAHSQQVWTVDSQGPLKTIQAAVDLAGNGDVILVRPGTYAPFDVVAKSLTIVGDPAAEVSLFAIFPPGIPFDRALEIRQLAADQRVVLRGIDFRIAVLDPLPTVELAGNAGSVLFEDCEIQGSVGAAVSVGGSQSVTFVRCRLAAGGPFLSAGSSVFQTAAGLQALSSNVYLFESDVRGSQGKDWVLISPTTSAGGPGLALKSGFVLAQGSSLQGGRGGQVGPVGFQPCIPLQAGGAGAVLEETLGSARLVLLSSDLSGGPGGQPVAGCPELPGPTGPAQVVLGGQLQSFGAEARAFGWSGLVREGQSAELFLAGQPGDQALLFVAASGSPGSFLEPALLAPHLELGSLVLLPLPALPASGVLASALTAPNLPAGVQVRALCAQALFLASNGELFLSGPSELRLLDAAL